MAFQLFYKIPFVSLRSGTAYTVNIYKNGTPGSNYPLKLKGGAEPMTTEEDASEDQFTPIRSQSGYFRMVDDGYATNSATTPQQVSFNWKDLLPATDSDHPVTLTDGNGNVVWQGFMQSQTFSGALYGNPQEREFPVICPLGVLSGEDIDFNAGLKNFAYLLKSVCDTIDTKSGNVVTITNLVIQGGADARNWLLTKIDWQNFATEDADGVMRAKYSIYEVLEDMCRFWGWTARTKGTVLYLTASDDSAEQSFLTLTRAQLDTLAGGTSAGSTSSTIPSVTLADTSNNHIFASTDQTDSKVQGPHRAVVKSDCNEHDTIVKFAPKDIEDIMGDSYTWVQGDGDLVGYFTTPTRQGSTAVGSQTMKISTTSYGGYCRRQIYQSTDAESPIVGDMLMALANRPSYGSSIIQLQTLRPMSFGGGSISLSGTLWRGAEPLQEEKNRYAIRIRLGIGMTRESAKWWYMNDMSTQQSSISCGWTTSSQPSFNVPLNGNSLKSTGLWMSFFIGGTMYIYPAIPVAQNTYGYVFIDIMGGYDYTNNNNFDDFQIANFTIEYSRDSYNIPSSIGEVRPRELVTERVTTKEYSAVNQNDSKEEWNANCIFASDNNMEYGYGLLLNSSGNILSTVNYGGTPEHPEQHLANRVTTYWATAKRKIDTELQANKVGDVTPHTKVTISGESGYIFTPIAISRNWRDDVLKLSLLQL